jgi:hypothetical protein
MVVTMSLTGLVFSTTSPTLAMTTSRPSAILRSSRIVETRK